MKLNGSYLVGARTIAVAFALCAGSLSLGAVSAAASGVGTTTPAREHGGVGAQSGSMQTLAPLPIPGITLLETPVEHEPNANVPSIHYGSQDDPHNPSPVVPGINLNPQSVTHNPSPVVPGVNYDPIGVVHNPSPVVPSINYAPRDIVHNPSPVLPGIQLGHTEVTHTPNVPNHNINLSQHTNNINIPINLPNLNIDVNGMVNNISGGGRRGCRRRCGGGNHETTVNITVNQSSHSETTLNYRGGSTYVYVEDRTPTYTEFFHEEEILAHAGVVPLRAVCLDGSGGVHPASQVFPDEMVADNYEGEIYRCVIGTSMQVTMGEMVDGAKSFQDGWNVTCSAGEALTYGDGEVTCTPQIERRPCNERSLLRRHGPGEKLVTLNGMSMRSDTAASTLAMDGGVGAYRRY